MHIEATFCGDVLMGFFGFASSSHVSHCPSQFIPSSQPLIEPSLSAHSPFPYSPRHFPPLFFHSLLSPTLSFRSVPLFFLPFSSPFSVPWPLPQSLTFPQSLPFPSLSPYPFSTPTLPSVLALPRSLTYPLSLHFPHSLRFPRPVPTLPPPLPYLQSLPFLSP